MAFPQVQTSNISTEDIANVSSHTVNYPSGIVLGDVLLCGIAFDGAPTSITFPSGGGGWTIIVNQARGADVTFVVAYRNADGTESGTFEVTHSGGTQRSSHIIYRIDEHDTIIPPDEAGSVVTGDSVNPDPGNCDPSVGTKDYLFITIHGRDRDDNVTTFPSLYTANQLNQSGGGANSAGCSSATRQLAASATDVGQWLIAGIDEWVACTIAIHPIPQAEHPFKALPSVRKAMLMR